MGWVILKEKEEEGEEKMIMMKSGRELRISLHIAFLAIKTAFFCFIVIVLQVSVFYINYSMKMYWNYFLNAG